MFYEKNWRKVLNVDDIKCDIVISYVIDFSLSRFRFLHLIFTINFINIFGKYPFWTYNHQGFCWHFCWPFENASKSLYQYIQKVFADFFSHIFTDFCIQPVLGKINVFSGQKIQIKTIICRIFHKSPEIGFLLTDHGFCWHFFSFLKMKPKPW